MAKAKEEKVEIEVVEEVKEKVNKHGIPVGRPLTPDEIKKAMAKK